MIVLADPNVEALVEGVKQAVERQESGDAVDPIEAHRRIDAELPAHRALDAGRLLGRLLRLHDDPLRPLDDDRPPLGERDPPRRPVEQAPAKRTLQRLTPAAHPGSRAAQRLGRRRRQTGSSAHGHANSNADSNAHGHAHSNTDSNAHANPNTTPKAEPNATPTAKTTEKPNVTPTVTPTAAPTPTLTATPRTTHTPQPTP